MSIFSSKTVVSVQATTVTLNDELPTDKLTTILVEAIRKESKNLSEHATYSALTGYRGSLNRFYNYGKDSYVHGLPETNIANSELNSDLVKVELDIIEGEACTIVDSYLRKPTAFAWAQQWLVTNEPTYNVLVQTLEQDTVTYDLVGAQYFRPIIGYKWVKPPGGDHEDRYQAPIYGPKVIKIYLLDGTNEAEYATEILLAEFPDDELYYMVEYFKDAAPATHFIWVYQPSLGTYPALDINQNFIFDPIFPIVPIRRNDVNINVDEFSQANVTTRGLLNTVKVDLDFLTEAVTTEINADGVRVPLTDLDLISDIFYMYGLNIYGDTQIEKKGLYLLFGDLHDQSRTSEQAYDNALSGTGAVPNNHFYIKTDNYNFYMNYNYSNLTAKAGKIADKGEYATGFQEISSFNHNRGEDISSQKIYRDTLFVRYQHKIDEYLELEIHGLVIYHEIPAKYRPLVATFHLTNYTEGADLSVEQQNMTIPLNINVVNGLTLREADQLISITAKLQVYASDSQKLKWYQSSFFRIAFQIVGFVLAFISLFTDPSGMTASEILIAVASVVAIKYAFEYILIKLLTEFAGDSFMEFFVQLVAVVVMITFMGPDGLLDMTSVEQMIFAVNAVAVVATTKVNVDLALLQAEMDLFNTDLDIAEAELTAAQDFLDNGASLLDPSAIIDSSNFRYEAPGDFYTRTLQTNPGVGTFDQLHNYVDINLNLAYIRV